MQHALEGVGGQRIGLTSDCDEAQVSAGTVKRVFEAVCCKLQVPEEEPACPDPKNLRPRVRALIDQSLPADDPVRGARKKGEP